MMPRGLRRRDAAAYVALGVSKFDQLVADGRMPPPKKADKVSVWDREQLDEAFDRLPTKEETSEIDQRLDAFADGLR
tara:strand:- start:23 stop:253 length:231 start_codon:yes stop_codon:yes gene_type:complete